MGNFAKNLNLGKRVLHPPLVKPLTASICGTNNIFMGFYAKCDI